MPSNYLELIACPDCQGTLKELKGEGQGLGFFCELCRLVYPVIGDIPILLPKSARNYELEFELIKQIPEHLTSCPCEGIKESVQNSLQLIETFKNRKSWEWEDEEFWSREYEKEAAACHQKEWGVRIWQIEWLVKELFDRTELKGKIIIDVGCGEGQIFRVLLAPFCDADSLYIAADISLEALKLNRLRNPHRNSFYVLCSADRLPFSKNRIDLLCYFGILHHAERKSATIVQDCEIVAPGGFVLLQEAIDRPYPSSFFSFFRKGGSDTSAHEERVNRNELMLSIKGVANLEIVASREWYTILFGLTRRLLGIKWLNKKWVFCLLFYSDIIFLKMLGWISSALSSAEIMLLLRKTPIATNVLNLTLQEKKFKR